MFKSRMLKNALLVHEGLPCAKKLIVKFSDAVHNLYQKNSLMDSWKTNTLNPYLGFLLLFIKS